MVLKVNELAFKLNFCFLLSSFEILELLFLIKSSFKLLNADLYC